MANWCEGTLKIRGEVENVKRFLLEGCIHKERCVREDEFQLILTIPKGTEFYVKGTERNYVQSSEIIWGKYEPVLAIPHYIGAWRIDATKLTELSEEYQVDLKILSFECGAGENVDFEVHKGKIVKFIVLKYDSYEEYRWECLEPDLGG